MRNLLIAALLGAFLSACGSSAPVGTSGSTSTTGNPGTSGNPGHGSTTSSSSSGSTGSSGSGSSGSSSASTSSGSGSSSSTGASSSSGSGSSGSTGASSSSGSGSSGSTGASSASTSSSSSSSSSGSSSASTTSSGSGSSGSTGASSSSGSGSTGSSTSGTTTGGSTSGTTTGSSGAPANDLCQNASPLQLGVPVTGTTLGAANDYDFKNTTCTGSFTAGGDVVYDFTAAISGSYTFTLDPSGWDGELYLLDSCTGAGNGMDACVAGVDQARAGGEEQLTVSLTAGQDVKLFVDSYGATGGAFSLRVDSILAAECQAAPRLQLANVGDSITFSGTTVGDGGNDSATCGGFGPEQVYLLDPSADVRLDVSLTSLSSDGGGMVPVVYVSNTCGFEAGELGCNGGNVAGDTTSLELNHLPPDGGPYFLYLDSRMGSEGPYQATVSFNTPIPPPPNDNCEGTVPSIALSPSGDGGLVGAAPYDTRYADDTVAEPSYAGCIGYDNGGDSVFQLVLAQPASNVEVSATGPSGYYQALFLRYGPTCLDQDPLTDGGAGTAAACNDFGLLDTGPLPAGTYYLWVDGPGQGTLSVAVW